MSTECPPLTVASLRLIISTISPALAGDREQPTGEQPTNRDTTFGARVSRDESHGVVGSTRLLTRHWGAQCLARGEAFLWALATVKCR